MTFDTVLVTLSFLISLNFVHDSTLVSLKKTLLSDSDCKVLIAAAASEPEANERGSSLISRRLHYRGLQSLFLTKRKEL